MEIKTHQNNGTAVLEITANEIVINNAQDLLDIMSEYSARKLIFKKESIHPDFYELKTGLAGEILQKASNYGLSIGIVGDFRNIGSKSLRDFIFESNRTGQVVFKDSVDLILDVFARK